MIPTLTYYSDFPSGTLPDIYSDVLVGILSGILCHILSDNLSGILPAILSDIYSDILFAILPGNLSGIFSNSLSTLSIWHLCDILSGIYSGILLAFFEAFILTLYLASMLTFYLAFYLTYTLTFYLEYLTYILAVYLTFSVAFCMTYVLASIWRSFWHSISHVFGSSRARPQDPELAVWSSGPGVPTVSGPCNTVFRSRRASIRSSRHGVRVQACSAASGAVRFGSQGTARAEMRRRRSCTFVKIWRPSLAGVEKPNLSLFPLSA